MNKTDGKHFDVMMEIDPSDSYAHRHHPNHHYQSINSSFNIADTELMMSTSSLTSSGYGNLPLKNDTAIPRAISSVEYLAKDDFIHPMSDDVPLNLQATGTRYRQPRLQNSHKLTVEESNFSSFALKNLHNEIQDLSFSEELPQFVRPSHSIPPTNQHYYKPVGSSGDVYHSDFPDEFSNVNFCPTLPSTSTIFSQNETSSPYMLPESQSDELLLNGIDLSDHEKLILSNEDLAMLTQGKQGCCLELILNNGEVIYTVVDSENDYNPPSPRLSQISREILSSVRSYETDIDDGLVNHVNDPTYENSIVNATNLNSRAPPVSNFHQNTTHYPSVISSSLGKSISSPSVNEENFNLCCDFPADGNDSFPTVIDPYQPVVPEKSSSIYGETLLQNDQTSFRETKKMPLASQPPNRVNRVPSKVDYFPSAVNSIVVSETGKKYPKKYSFYSNISSFMNQETFEKGNDDKNAKTDKEVNVCQNSALSSIVSTSRAETITRSCANVHEAREEIEILNSSDLNETLGFAEVNQTKPVDQEVASKVNQIQETIVLEENVNDGNERSIAPANQIIASSLPSISNSFLYQKNTPKEKSTNLCSEVTVNSICDRAVQSRARATLPDLYLSINRIKHFSSYKKFVYGVFARKMIPNRTQFGPVEGVLVKEDIDEEVIHDDNCTGLKLTIEMETGKFHTLDVSNEDTCNWMKFVRPATSCEEQNLILDQKGNSLYFTTITVIHPNQELLVWYSDEYSRARNYKQHIGDLRNNVPSTVCEKLVDSVLVTVPSVAEKKTIESIYEPSSDVEITDVETSNACLSNQVGCSSHVKNQGNEMGLKVKKTKNVTSAASTNGKKYEKSKKKLWLCPYCDFTFSNASVMDLHILVHVADDAAKTNPNDLVTNNQQSASDMESFECPQCCQKFKERKELITHVSKHGLRVQRWKDGLANSEEETARGSAENFITRTYPCLSCHKSFKTALALDFHTRFHFATLECPMCEMTFKKLPDMQEHVRTHAINGIFTCPHCPKTYDQYKYMRKHIRACHGKIIFSCKLCKKTCKSQYKLRSHMLRHSDEKEFLCSICGKLFKRMDKLSEHVKHTHSEEREKIKMEEVIKREIQLKKSLKKKLSNKVLRLITDNVSDYFYKCYICNIGFKRRGMLVNHLNMFHPAVSLDTIPELNVPIQKAYCNFYCLHCDKVYKSNSKRKEHILKSHPGAKLPNKSERGSVLSDPFAKQVGNVISDPFNCEFCHRQYVSRAKLLGHHRQSHADLLPADLKSPRNSNSKKKKRKEVKATSDYPSTNVSKQGDQLSESLQPSSVPYESENCINRTTTAATILPPTIPPVESFALTSKYRVTDRSNEVANLSPFLGEDTRNAAAAPEQYLKNLQSSNSLSHSQTDENSTALLQQILTSYPFPDSKFIV